MYVNMLRRVPRPRGLGGVAQVAAGLGAWVVDRPWGLSPAIIPGQPRPYQGMVRTQLPRSQHPRLLNASYRVVAGGSWPRLLPAGSPVFRTPVMAPGAQAVNEALPGDSVPRGVAGYGWVPMGVAHPPYFLAEKGPMSGLGGITTSADLSSADREWLEANPRKVAKAIKSSATAYAYLRAQQNVFHNVYQTFLTLDQTNQANAKQAGGDAMQRATQLVYGSADAKFQAAKQLQRMAAAAAQISLIVEREGITVDGPLSVLSSQPTENPAELLKGTRGVGIGVTAIVIISVIAVGAVATTTGMIMANFNEADAIAARAQESYLASTRVAREAQAEVLADLSRQLGNTTDPTDAQRIREAIASITASMAAISGANADITNRAGATNWSQMIMIGGAGVFIWWILGKPFWKGARRSAEASYASYGMPTPLGG